MPVDQTAITVLPLALVNVCNVVAGLVGTAGLTVPMFIALRRFTFVTTIIAEYVMYKRVQESKTYAWIAIIISGSLIAAFNDLSFNFEGYMASTYPGAHHHPHIPLSPFPSPHCLSLSPLPYQAPTTPTDDDFS